MELEGAIRELLKGISEPELYGDLVYKFIKVIGNKTRNAVSRLPALFH